VCSGRADGFQREGPNILPKIARAHDDDNILVSECIQCVDQVCLGNPEHACRTRACTNSVPS
jgi:hypothetical protein